MSFKVSVLATAAAAAFFVGPASAQVANGDFSGPSGGMATTFVQGWNVGGNVDVKSTATWAAQAAWAPLLSAKPGSGVAGDQFLDLSGDVPGMITQNLATVAGQAYRLTFDYAANVWASNTATFVASVYWGSGGIHQVLTGNSSNWSAGVLDFTPEGQTTLAFMSTTPPDAPDSPAKRSGALLDNIAVAGLNGFAVPVQVQAFNGALPNGFNDPVAAVPEPETYAMMLLGLAAIGFVSRRRQQAAKDA